MNGTIDRLLRERVSEVMTQNVVEIPSHETLAATADILRKHGVSGAPVVDEQGRCVGIISGTDFVEEKSATRIEKEAAAGGLNYQMVQCDAEGLYYIEEISANDVDSHMSMRVQTISADAGLAKAAQAMCQDHIHRLIVLNDDGQPIGVLSSLDIVRTLILSQGESET